MVKRTRSVLETSGDGLCAKNDLWDTVEKHFFPALNDEDVEFLTKSEEKDPIYSIPRLGRRIVQQSSSLKDGEELRFNCIVQNKEPCSKALKQSSPTVITGLNYVSPSLGDGRLTFKYDTKTLHFSGVSENIASSSDLSFRLLSLFKCMPQNDKASKYQLNGNVSNENNKDREDISILAEIEKLQSELKVKEVELQKNLESIAKKVKKDAEDPLKKKKLSDEDDVVKRWIDKKEKLRYQHLEEERKRQDELEATCAVCNTGETTHKDPIVFCDCCNIGVHLSCYKITGTLPKGDWYCRPCSQYILGGGRPRDQLQMQANGCSSVKGIADLPCALCPLYGGAYTSADVPPTTVSCSDQKESDTEIEHYPYGSNNGYVHMACAQWLSHQYKDIIEAKNGGYFVALHLQRQEAQGRKRKCLFCKQTHGSTIRCTADDCLYRFHVLCARRSHNVYMDNIHCEDGANKHWNVFCPTHAIEYRVNDTK